jgi:hypothetical protein
MVLTDTKQPMLLTRSSVVALLEEGASFRLTAAKDRTFKTVRPNQGTASETVPIRRQPSL